MKPAINLLFSLLAASAFLTHAVAENGHSHDRDQPQASSQDHMATLGDIRLLHAWAPETQDSNVRVFVEIQNDSAQPITLLGAQADFAARTELVGFQAQGGESRYVRLPKVSISAGAKMILEPNGVAFQMIDIDHHLHAGDFFNFTVKFEQGSLAMKGQVEHASATQHSHTGHNH